MEKSTNTMQYKLYIHGQLQDAKSGRFRDNINPANGQTIGQIDMAGEQDVALAIDSAKQGFAQWSRMTGAQRGRILQRAALLLRERNEELAKIEVADTGKPITEAMEVDIFSGADAIEYFAGLAPTLHGHHYDLGQSFAFTRREPLGITAGIGAWNYPLQIAAWKSGPALACGNAMIFKPSELTPATALKLAEIYSLAGVPDGVFNVLQGEGDAGQMLVKHEDVAKISLTGEVATGKKVMADAALTLKNITLELGGKSPLIIFEDSDLENAVSAAIMANFYTQGEICSNGTRVFVQEKIHDAFAERIVQRMKGVKLGNPMDPATNMGALISEEHLQKVLFYLNASREAGAEFLCGGNRAVLPGLENGYFVEPTIIDNCHDNMRCVREEIFGPVMSLLTFASEDEVIERANDTVYGLAAGVFTRDIARAHRVIARLQAGTCWINNYNITPIEMPFGGYKQSGLGRENSLAAIEHYTQLKSVYVEMGDVQAPF